MRLSVLLLLATLAIPSAHAQTDRPGGYRLPNIAIGLNHHHDSMLVSHLNIGLRPEVDSLRGLQLGVFYGGIRYDARGMMMAGVANAAHAMRGLQLSGYSNIVFTPMRGIQLSTLTNIAMGVKCGIQVAGAANISSGYMHGLQLSAYNYADTLNGSQVGLINVAQNHPKGVQVGIINYTGDTIARKVGLVNINPNTRIDLMAFGGNTSKFNLAFRFRNRSTYSILGLGTHYAGFDGDFSGALFYRIGQYFRLSPRWSVGGDVGFYHVESFKKNSEDAPRQLYSFQTHLNFDYQINPTCGAFVSAGYGTTRHYGSNHNYRTGFILQGGLTFRYHRNDCQEDRWMAERERDMEYHLRQLSETPEDQLYRFTDPDYTRRRWGRAIATATGINVLVHSFDRFVLDEDFAKVNFKSIAANWRHAFVWDNDQFSTNLFAHPYHGNLYFNSARSNGLSFWQSTPFALGGSLMWEFCGEVEPPAINDLIATTFGGICLGEITHRISALILNDRSRGFRRFLREAAATVINPMQGFTRIVDGDAARVRREKFLYHDFSRIPVEFAVTTGVRFLADDGGLFRGVRLPYLSFYLNYGDAFNDNNTQPYDYFTAKVSMSLSGKQPFINGVHLLGRLWSDIVYEGKEGQTLIGLFQHFNYYDSEPIKDGTNLTPYRISEAAAFGPGIFWEFPRVGNLSRLEQRIFADLILLGGTKSDYYNIIDRDYNMGSGFSIKSNTCMEFPHLGMFVLNIEYYRIFTWKGYEGKDLSTINPLMLNAQGDRGNAQLLVFNPLFVVHLKHNIGLEISGSYYARQTHYKYYDDVRAKTFEIKGGLLYRF
ncbi:MAG: DUF3943 domain-containing protein [Prevotella sp.]|nr:DUF3943 domain-containing protein [Prevotella sp.]